MSFITVCLKFCPTDRLRKCVLCPDERLREVLCMVARKLGMSNNIARVLPYLIPYWRHHGTFLNKRTAVRPSDDVCKSLREARARAMLNW